jgi:hypothetical protein
VKKNVGFINYPGAQIVPGILFARREKWEKEKQKSI